MAMVDSTDPAARRVVAVLGATGCVGAALCEAFTAAGHRVVAVARRRPTRYAGTFASLDVAAVPPEDLGDLFRRHHVGVVVNATGGWLDTPDANERYHVHLVRNLLAAMTGLPGRPRLVQIGSIHEYGPVPAGTTIGEDHPARPGTVYARTKLAGARAVVDAADTGAVNGVVLRSVNVFGPGVTPVSFLGTVVDRLRQRRPGQPLELTVQDVHRDYVDVRDLAAAVVRAADAGAAGQILNIGRGEALSLRQTVDRLVRLAGFPPEAVGGAGPVQSRGGDWTQADITAARRILGWSPAITPERSIRDMWEASAMKSESGVLR
jgi:NDP-hexose 4-ketoreductase